MDIEELKLEELTPGELRQVIDDLKNEMAILLVENLSFKSDSLFALYFALNRKGNEAANSLNAFTLMLTKDKDNKEFERFKLLMAMLPDMAKTISSLRNDYLKVGEEEASEIELKGVPLIEQKRKSGSGKGGLTKPGKPSVQEKENK